MRIDIHIGAPKAGSTAIQQFLKANRHTLEAAGIRIVSLNSKKFRDLKRASDGSRRIPHWPFMRRRKNRRCFEDIRFEDIKQCISNSAQHRGVISSEYLFQITNEAAIKRFKSASFRSNDELSLLLYVRDPLSTKRAMYSTAISQGSARPYSHYREPPFTLNLNDRINIWRRVFGNQSVAVKLYRREQFLDGDIQKSFVTHLIDTGLEELIHSDLDYTHGSANASLKPGELEIIRALNKLNRRSPKPLSDEALRTCQIKWLEFAKTQIGVPEHSWSEPDFNGFMLRCRQQNQLVMQQYFPAVEKNWIEHRSIAYLDELSVNDSVLKETYTAAQDLLTQHVKGESVLKLIGMKVERSSQTSAYRKCIAFRRFIAER